MLAPKTGEQKHKLYPVRLDKGTSGQAHQALTCEVTRLCEEEDLARARCLLLGTNHSLRRDMSVRITDTNKTLLKFE